MTESRHPGHIVCPKCGQDERSNSIYANETFEGHEGRRVISYDMAKETIYISDDTRWEYREGATIRTNFYCDNCSTEWPAGNRTFDFQ